MLVAAVGSADWVTYHGDRALSGRVASAVSDRPARLWRYRLGARVDWPVVSGKDRLFIAGKGGRLAAVSIEGKELWARKYENTSFSSPGTHHDNAFIIGTRQGKLLSISAETGDIRWEYTMGGPVLSAPNVAAARGDPTGKGIIAVSQENGAIHCVNADDGTELWRTGELDRCDGSPAVSSDRIVMGSCARAVHVFSADGKKRIHDIDLGPEGEVAGGVAIDGDLAFAGTHGGKFACVNIKSGKRIWIHDHSDNEAFATPAVAGKYVIFASDDGYVHCLRKTDGSEVWKFDTDGLPLSPVVAKDRVVVSSEGTLYTLDLKKGTRLWLREVSDDITSPAVIDGMIIVGTDDGFVEAFGKKNELQMNANGRK